MFMQIAFLYMLFDRELEQENMVVIHILECFKISVLVEKHFVDAHSILELHCSLFSCFNTVLITSVCFYVNSNKQDNLKWTIKQHWQHQFWV